MGLATNARWVGVSQIVKILIQAISLAVLARYIPPREYGLMAMATVVSNFANLLKDMGTSAAIIQSKNISGNFLNTIFAFNMVIGFGLMILVVFSARIVSLWFSEEALNAVLYAISPVFFASCSAIVHQAIEERNSNFKKVALIEMFSNFLGLMCAIFLAINGAGVYALVGQMLLTSIVSAVLYWYLSSWRPSSSFDRSDISSVLSFSGYLTAFNFVNYFSRNSDGFVVGKFLGSGALGIYSLAYRIMMFPLQSITFVSSRAMLPILSRGVGDIKYISSTYLNVISFIAFVSAPLMTGLYMLREPFIYYAFGTQWKDVPELLVWLAPVGFIQSVVSTAGSLLTALARTPMLFKLGVVGSVLQITSFFVGVGWGLKGVVACYFIANLINAILVLGSVFFVIKCDVFLMVRKLAAPIFSSFVMACLGFVFLLIFSADGIYGFIGAIIFMGFVYSALSFFTQNENLKKLYRLILAGR
jgi:O-antigen/teichoic acid export membrane protein